MSQIAKWIFFKLQNIFVSNCKIELCYISKLFVTNFKMYLSQISKCICLKFINVFVSNKQLTKHDSHEHHLRTFFWSPSLFAQNTVLIIYMKRGGIITGWTFCSFDKGGLDKVGWQVSLTLSFIHRKPLSHGLEGSTLWLNLRNTEALSFTTVQNSFSKKSPNLPK